MSSSSSSVEEKIQTLPPDLRAEAIHYIDELVKRSKKRSPWASTGLISTFVIFHQIYLFHHIINFPPRSQGYQARTTQFWETPFEEVSIRHDSLKQLFLQKDPGFAEGGNFSGL